jgi:hypothetical protein
LEMFRRCLQYLLFHFYSSGGSRPCSYQSSFSE